MASVTSFGIHQPTGLQYAVQEGLVTADVPSSYTWQNLGEDELLITSRCVIWSRGGIFRKSYKFDLEKEEVTQALLTTFPSVGPLAGRNSEARAPAIVVFLQTQAHVYFLTGTSHVIHLPFEVESAIAAPVGVIIQRKVRHENLAPVSLQFPRVPPNSFVSSHPQAWSATSSVHSTFSIADLGRPKQMPVAPLSTFNGLWDPPAAKNDANWPRLFSLSDPLAEMGLVVSHLPKPQTRKHRRSSNKLSTLDTAEEILFVSGKSELSNPGTGDDLVIALTLNRETSIYTVWKLSYIGQETGASQKQRAPSGTASRRRSSFVPGTGTGATTPVPSQQNVRESFGGNPTLNGAGKSFTQDEERDRVVDFVSTLDPDYEASGVPRRKSRRVSSMLARQDLSASHERSAFSELAAGHQLGLSRRGESLGSQHARTSGFGTANGQGPTQSVFNNSISSFLEAPVDDLLDELRAGGDFEGFHNMGLDEEEFDALRQEIVLTKVSLVPAEHSNVRYSSQHIPAKNQCKVFTLTSPSSAADDRQGYQIVVCVLDPDEERLIVLTLFAKAQKTAHIDVHSNPIKTGKDITGLSVGPLKRVKEVLDACRLDDGPISRMLVLSKTPDGFGEVTLQAPWSTLMKVSLPGKFAMSNIRNLSHDSSVRARREGGFRRVLSQGPRALRGLCNAKPRGLVDLVDDEGKMHQIRIHMQPQNPYVRTIIDVCRAVITSNRGGEGMLVAWWNVMYWLQLESISTADAEWTALVITLFSLVLGLSTSSKPLPNRGPSKRKPKAGHLRSSSGANIDLESWRSMQAEEAPNGSPFPSWAGNRGWQWLDKDSSIEIGDRKTSGLSSPIFSSGSTEASNFVQRHVKLARDFISTSVGQTVVSGCLPTTGNRSHESRMSSLRDTFVGLHLLCQEQKLDTMKSDAFSSGNASLIPVLSQMSRWLGWTNWITFYEAEEATVLESMYDSDSPLRPPLQEPFEPPSIYDWVQNCLTSRSASPFPSLLDCVSIQSGRSRQDIYDQCVHFTPRTCLFEKFFSKMRTSWSSIEFVEGLFAAGMDKLLLETLPEAVLATLQEAILECQTEPPTTWSKRLLTIVGREDVNILLSPGQRLRHTQSTLLAPSHDANYDVHTICSSTADIETTGSFDGSAEVDRLAISRAIFDDDRRVNDAMAILNTFRPTVARIKPRSHWSESELLDAQKEHVTMLAYRTLAIASGRGLLYYSARIPLLTQRFAIGGFNLHCIMRPDNNSVSVDKKELFMEEKVAWAFFHAGVAAGLSISREARGIDTSWILYNKPATELSNRHAGFLFALGLNGHLKSVAKWVAFKYLTPKHSMTSIGLLLGLAASYIGTMDSLITRLLSVHVTRMLPPGAAELNLSPLVQTTGIMGIGLLYCNTQHRRMSEVMVSEIEHIDTETDDEPLRNEGYRLAAGFALGFINLGKSSDLKGLQDMRLTERLLALAAGTKQVDLVHVLDKATAAAVVAIALIFMKSENQVLARKIDVPESLLQFDYIRPDIFLLRTLAKHLIMWSKIEPSREWVDNNLPKAYNEWSLANVTTLTTEDLPFFNIIAGLCFSIALRYAGSFNAAAKDTLLYYLDHFMRLCRIKANTYDKKLTKNTVRNCQDLVALAVSTVMAGKGDIHVFRRLRSLHGRDDKDTPYGSHLAAHLAIGTLFLGSGTFTFGTSNLATAALLVAFYPLFPTNVQDNQSHLQAFRHFWVLAAEPRCLVARDIDTNQVVSVPITVTPRVEIPYNQYTPFLLPELHNLKEVRTTGTEYWPVVLDFQKNETHVASFKATQTIYVRRRPTHDAGTSAFQTTLQALNDVDDFSAAHPLEWIFELPAFATLTKAERALVLPPDRGDARADTEETVVDTRLMLEHATLDSGNRDRLLGLRLLFEWADKQVAEHKDPQWVRIEVVERLKAKVWMMAEMD